MNEIFEEIYKQTVIAKKEKKNHFDAYLLFMFWCNFFLPTLNKLVFKLHWKFNKFNNEVSFF